MDVMRHHTSSFIIAFKVHHEFRQAIQRSMSCNITSCVQDVSRNQKELLQSSRSFCKTQEVDMVSSCASQGKAKKGGQKKGPGSLMDIPKQQAEEIIKEPYEETEVIMDNLLLIESFSRNVGR